ncbi:MAG: efflux RND transporter periplasmic adaptor subunit [Gammaproteobacteria bacterium]|nr:efflux RND transporter periplasmic adaptor subunit [Gammaproteobacteria bacterium]
MTKVLSGLHLHTPLPRLLCPALVILGVTLPALGADPAPVHTLDCVLEPYEVVEVSSAVQGVINEIHVDRNDMVGKGQLLVKLDSDVERTQVELAKARARLQTNIELRETELAFNVRNQKRLEKLYKTDTISLHIKDEAETDTLKSRLQLRSARDNKRLAELELAKAEAILALRSMHSPIAGVVVARNKVAGEFVEDQSILRLAQLDPLRVEVIAPVELFGSIAEGMRVEVLPEHSEQRSYIATVTMVDRMIDPASGTFDVRAELPNPDLAIPSGLRCTVVFLDEPDLSAAMASAATPAAEPVAASVDEPVVAAVTTPAAAATAEPELEAIAEPEVDLFAEPGQTADAASEQAEEPAEDIAATGNPPGRFNSNLETASMPAALCEDLTLPETTAYRVLADTVENSAEIRDLVDSLRTKGVHDLFVMMQGVSRVQVSLGVYSILDNAEKRQAEISSYGFMVTLEPHMLETKNPDCEAEGHIADNGR